MSRRKKLRQDRPDDGRNLSGSAGVLPAVFDSLRGGQCPASFFSGNASVSRAFVSFRGGLLPAASFPTLMKIMRPGTLNFHLQRLDVSRLYGDDIVLML